MSSNNTKFDTPPSKSTSAKNNDAPPSTKALIHAKNVLQNLRRDLYKAKLREVQLFNSLKKVKANYNKSLAEKHRIQSAIDNQAFICSNLEHQYGEFTMTPESACTVASSFSTSPQDHTSPLAKKGASQTHIRRNKALLITIFLTLQWMVKLLVHWK